MKKNKFIIRRATINDKKEVLELVGLFYGESAPEMLSWWKENFDNIKDKPLIAVSGKEIVAYVACSTDYEPGTWYIGDLYVKPNFRKQGIATGLLIETERDAKELGLKMRVDNRKIDKEANSLYTKLGFRLLGEKNSESLKLVKETK